MADRPNFTIGIGLSYGLCLGGTTNWALGLARRLNAGGHPTILLDHPSRRHEPYALADDPHVVVTRCHECHDERLDDENVAAYRRLLPGVLVPGFTPGNYAVCAALSQHRADDMRVIAFCHTYLDYYFRLLTYYEPMIHRFVAVSRECGERLAELLPDRRADICVRPYGIDLPASVQRTYSPAGQPLRLLYAGRIQQRDKRVFDLLSLAAKLSDLKVNFVLRVVGDGFDKPEFVARHRELDEAVRSRVQIENAVPPSAMPDILQASDVCVMVSEAEGTSIFLLESIGYGCVPVVTSVSGTTDVIAPGYNGFSHPVGDLDAIAASVAKLDRDRALLGTMGRHAVDRSRSFDFGAYTDWFSALAVDAWQDPMPRPWPAGRPLLPPRSLRQRIGDSVPWARSAWRWLRGGTSSQT